MVVVVVDGKEAWNATAVETTKGGGKKKKQQGRAGCAGWFAVGFS